MASRSKVQVLAMGKHPLCDPTHGRRVFDMGGVDYECSLNVSAVEAVFCCNCEKIRRFYAATAFSLGRRPAAFQDRHDVRKRALDLRGNEDGPEWVAKDTGGRRADDPQQGLWCSDGIDSPAMLVNVETQTRRMGREQALRDQRCEERRALPTALEPRAVYDQIVAVGDGLASARWTERDGDLRSVRSC